MTKVSIITVCYNSENTIERTIKSVIGQTGIDLEYIIIDGGSTDCTLSIISHYSPYIYSVVSEKDGGIYDAMNKGLKKVTGDIIGIINSDDWYEKDALQTVVEIFSCGRTDIVSGALYDRSEAGDVIRKTLYPVGNPWEQMAWGHPSVFFSKKVYDKIGGFDDTYRVSADYKWLLLCLAKGFRFTYTDKVLANYTIGGTSQSNALQKAREDYRVKKELFVFCPLAHEQKETILSKAGNALALEITRSMIWDNSVLQKRLIELIPNVDRGIILYGYGKLGKKTKNILEKQGVMILEIADRGAVGVDNNSATRIMLDDLAVKTENTILVCVANPDSSIVDCLNDVRKHNIVLLNDLFICLGKTIQEEHISALVT